MGLTGRNDSCKLRNLMALANGSLAVGLLLRMFVHPAGSSAHAALDFFVGLLLGISVTVNIHALLLRKRSRQKDA